MNENHTETELTSNGDLEIEELSAEQQAKVTVSSVLTVGSSSCQQI